MTQPGDKLTEFSARWNDLRNAVIGRGVTPPPGVSQSLYERTGNAYSRWRTYLAQMPAPMALLPAQALADWVRQYRALADEARAAGLRFRVLPVGWTEHMLTGRPESHPSAADGGGHPWLRLALCALVLAVPIVLCSGGGRSE